MHKSIPMQQKPVSILVIDDEKDIADSVREVIQGMVRNCRVETADSCAHGLDAMKRENFDAVLVDYKMPGNTGLEFIRQAHMREPGLPAILMTAYPSMEIATKAVNECHVDGFLAKPIDPVDLAEAVEGAIHRSTEVPGDGSQHVHW